MTVPQIGYAGLGSAVFAASSLTQNLGVAVGIVTLLVLLSTLLIRFTATVQRSTQAVIHKMQADGDLPTRLERDEILKAIASLVEHNRTEER